MIDVPLLLVMILASYRGWRIVGKDTWPPSEWFRSQVEERAENERGWVWHYVETLITCPWCLGSWIAFAVVAIVDAVVGLPLPLLQAFAVAGAVGLIGGSLDG